MEDVVLLPNEEELTEKVEPEPKSLESEIKDEPSLEKKEYLKPTFVSYESVEENEKKENFDNTELDLNAFEPKEVEPEDDVEDEEFFEEDEEYDDNDEFDSYNFEPEEDEPLESKEEQRNAPQEEKSIEEDYYVAESTVSDIDTKQEVETEILLPSSEESPLEEVLLGDQQTPPLQNLENESYDKEFEPKEPVVPIEVMCKIKEVVEQKEYPKDSMKQTMEKYVHEQTSYQMHSEPIPMEVSSPKELSPMPSNQSNEFMPLIPAGPVMDSSSESSSKAVTLEQNPYFRSKKMNFHLKPIILTIVSVLFFIGVFISIFAILHAFK